MAFAFVSMTSNEPVDISGLGEFKLYREQIIRSNAEIPEEENADEYQLPISDKFVKT